MAAATLKALSDSARGDARAFGEALFARSLHDAPPADRMAWFVDDLDDFVAHLNTRARLLFLFCLFAVTWVAPLLTGRLARLRALPLEARLDALEALERSPASLALFGARAIVSLVYYEHPDAAAEIGWDRKCLAEVQPERVAASRLVSAQALVRRDEPAVEGSVILVTGAIVSGAAHQGDLDLDCDVVIVGSGAGGATMATELALAGKRVIVLEEGKQIPAAEHGAMRQSESLRHVWREGGMTAALGLFGAPTINVTMGRVLGGSSVVTGGVCFRVPDSILRTWSRDMALADFTPENLDRYYRHVEEAIHVEEVPVEMRSRSTELFAKGCDALGIPIHPMSRNTKGCDGCGRCNFGCPHGAKLSVDLSYLPRAVAAGAMLYTDCLVDRVTMKDGRAIGVEGRVMTGPIGTKKGRLRVRAKRVVVACGGMHTPLLLRASGLAHVGSHIGRNLTLHPGLRLYARFDEKVRGWQGALQSAYVDAFEHEGVTLTGLFVPASVIAATMPYAGPRHAALTEQIEHIAMFGALVHDDGGGSIHRNPFGREPVAFYRCTARDQARIRFGIRKMIDIFLAAGAREVFLPILGSDGLSPDAARAFDLDRIPGSRLEAASQHPLGTCRMSKHAADGVVDPWGRVWDTEGLYVADGSILPSSLGVNPQLTIMMAATRIAWRLAEENLSRVPLAA